MLARMLNLAFVSVSMNPLLLAPLRATEAIIGRLSQGPALWIVGAPEFSEFVFVLVGLGQPATQFVTNCHGFAGAFSPSDGFDLGAGCKAA
jgi:hypothetical protein